MLNYRTILICLEYIDSSDFYRFDFLFISNCQIGVARDVHSKIEIIAIKWENNGCINKDDSIQFFPNSIFSFLLWK